MIGVTSVTAVVLLSGLMVFSDKNKPPAKNTQYLEQISGFTPHTKIEITYQMRGADIITKNIETTKKSSVINNRLSLKEPYTVSYIIKNDNQNYIDINVKKTNEKIKATLSGLDKSSRVSLNLNNGNILPFTPVDWAGRIELDIPIEPNVNGYCLQILRNTETQNICYNSIKQVTS